MSIAALEAAVDLAARLGAELEALFIEDAALLQWTDLPFVRQVTLHGSGAVPLSQRELELQLRALSSHARKRLAALAALRQVRWSFRIARGLVQGEVVAAAKHADLLILGSTSRPVAREALFEPSVRSLIKPLRTPVLLVRSDQPARDPVHVLLESSGKTSRLLDAAATMAGGRTEAPVATVWVAEGPLTCELEGEVARARFTVRAQLLSDFRGSDALMSAVAGGILVLTQRAAFLSCRAGGRVLQGRAARSFWCLELPSGSTMSGDTVDADQS